MTINWNLILLGGLAATAAYVAHKKGIIDLSPSYPASDSSTDETEDEDEYVTGGGSSGGNSVAVGEQIGTTPAPTTPINSDPVVVTTPLPTTQKLPLPSVSDPSRFEEDDVLVDEGQFDDALPLTTEQLQVIKKMKLIEQTDSMYGFAGARLYNGATIQYLLR